MSTSNHYRARIQVALEFIDQQLSDKFSAADVARAASFSEYHFHRLFPAFMGESIHQYVRSRRMERAAMLLSEKPNSRLLDVAIEVGFETHSAFTRAFKQQFGISPSQFKNRPQRGSPVASRPSFIKTLVDTSDLLSTIQYMPLLHFTFRIAKGTASGQFYGEQRPDAELANLVQQSANGFFGVVSAFPVSPESLNDFSAEVWYGGLYTNIVENDWGTSSLQVEGGNWAVFDYVGAYDYLHQIWNQIYRAWLPNSGQVLRDTLPFEMYLNDPSQVLPAELLTQIWLPIE